MEQTLLPIDGLPEVAEPLDGRDEMNLAEFPLFSLHRRIPANQKTLRFEASVEDRRTGRQHTRKFQITGADAYGLPTARDGDVLMALLYYAKEQSKLKNQTVHFSRREMAKVLGWDGSGTSYRTIRDALLKWVGVTLEYQKSFWDAGDKKWKTIAFHVLEKVELEDETGRRRQHALPFLEDDEAEAPYSSSVRFSEEFFASLRNGYVKKLNLADFFSLSIPAAKQIYRFLDKRFYNTRRLEFDLREFAYERIGFSRAYMPSKIKEKLKPALEELEAIGFFKPATPAERYRQGAGRGEWTIIFERDERKALSKPLTVAKSERSATRALVKELCDRGMSPNVAQRIVEDEQASEAHIRKMIEFFDWKQQQPGEKPKRPGAWLAKAIREGREWVLDPSFRTAEERQAIAAAKSAKMKAEADRRVRERQEEEARSKQQAEAIAEQWRRIDDHHKTLTKPQQQALHEEAMTLVEPIMLRFVKDFLKNPRQRRGFGAEAYKTALLAVIDRP